MSVASLRSKPTLPMEGLFSAIEFAAKAHSTQRRKNRAAEPYINHPIAVANILQSVGVTDPYILMAAVLHDTVEDTGTSLDTIKERFGERVAHYVAECSDDKTLPKAERKRLQIDHIAKASLGAVLIKLADKLDNIRSLKSDPPIAWSPETVRGYVLWSKAVVDAAPPHTYVKLNRLLEEVFLEHGVTKSPTQEELEAYYRSC